MRRGLVAPDMAEAMAAELRRRSEETAQMESRIPVIDEAITMLRSQRVAAQVASPLSAAPDLDAASLAAAALRAAESIERDRLFGNAIALLATERSDITFALQYRRRPAVRS